MKKNTIVVLVVALLLATASFFLGSRGLLERPHVHNRHRVAARALEPKPVAPREDLSDGTLELRQRGYVIAPVQLGGPPVEWSTADAGDDPPQHNLQALRQLRLDVNGSRPPRTSPR